MELVTCSIRKDGTPAIAVPRVLLPDLSDGRVLALVYGPFWGAPFWCLTLNDHGVGDPVRCEVTPDTVTLCFPSGMADLDFADGELLELWLGVPTTVAVLLKHRPFGEAADV